MLTWGAWIKLMASLSPHDRAKCLSLTGLTFLCFPPIYLYGFGEKVEPITAPWTRMPAQLISTPEIWEYEKSIYGLGISYNAPDGQRIKAWMYVDRARYDAANISKTTPLFVDIEDTQSGTIARRLSTNDTVLSDPSLRQLVNETSDRKAVEGIVFFCTLSLLSFVGAAVTYWHNLRNKKQQSAVGP
jgi:hypothetical protein